MKPDAPITTKPVIDARHAVDESVADRDRRPHRDTARRVERMGRRRIAHRHRQADPRQRSRISSSARRSFGISRGSSRPKVRVRGATVPGEPIVLLGQNDNIAWGFTTADTDAQHLFIETVDPGDPSKYLTPDGPKAFDTREETIHVKDGADVKLTRPDDPARSRALRRQRGSREHRRARKGRRPRLYRPWRSRHDRRSDDAPQCGAQLGRVPRRYEALSDADRRTSSMPMSPATSASSAPASFLCANQATD